MITRIEIDGFKSFLDFKLDVPPFLALVGPNSSGKSNLFDALEYVKDSEVGSDSPLLDARRGRPHELFHRVIKGDSVTEFKIIAEAAASTEFGILAVRNSAGAMHGSDGGPEPTPGDFHILRQVTGLSKNRKRFEDASDAIAAHFARSVTENPDTSSDVVVETISRLRGNEVKSWQLYMPDPMVMRRPASTADMRPLKEKGDNLAAVLGRMRDDPAFDDLIIDLAALIPDVVRIVPELHEKRQEWSFDLVVDGQGPVPSTLLSDGTLRVLGLLAAVHDPDHSGVLMIEEIENGLHPSRLAELLRRIQERVTDLSDPESLDRPLRQVILTSHSPVVVSELYRMRRDSLVFMDTAVRVDPEQDRVSRVTAAKPVRSEGESGTYVSPRQVRKYLSTVRQNTS